MKDELTKRERELYDFLKTFRDENGYIPSQREMCQHMHVENRGTIKRLIYGLEQKGYIMVRHTKARALKIL